MPYIILAIGLLIGLFALYRFLLKAGPAQIRALFLAAGALGVAAALFFLSVTGRFPAALALVVAVLPVALGFWKSRKGARAQDEAKGAPEKQAMNYDEALEILGLEGSPSEKEIKDAYKRLMKKVHPDQEGSEWMAAKLNDAKDFLLKK